MGKKSSASDKTARDKRMAWWREAKFGMFIHWGLYAIPAGVWKGKDIPGIGEWIQKRGEIAVKEYEKLAEKFNPVNFNAREWVRVAKNAGMKYMVITSKHHDGFALFKSEASPYNIVDATPYGKDVIKALARECGKAGIRMCFYYSHKQDWNHPDASGNQLDYPDESKKNFARYMREKALPQVREILSNYGPIGLIWYDTPQDMTRAHSKTFRDLVLECQPKCLVSGRVGNDLGDYSSRGDNEVPSVSVEGDWETPATLNDTWGFKKHDRNWKSTRHLLHLLVDIVSKGGNYLLNVGPTAEGLIPEASVKRLEEVGQWLKVNGEAVYGSSAGPYPYPLGWAGLTAKPGKLFLLVTEWPGNELVLHGLKNTVKKASLLADKRKRLEFRQEYNKDIDLHTLRLKVPSRAPDKNVSVVALDIAGKAAMDQSLLQRSDGKILLEAHAADIQRPKTGPGLRQGRFGVVENWRGPQDRISWDVKVVQPGEYEALVLSQTSRQGQLDKDGKWAGGHQMRLAIGSKSVIGVLQEHDRIPNPKAPVWLKDVVSKLGRVTIAKPGIHRVVLRPEKMVQEKAPSLRIRSVQLVPVA